MVGSKRAWLTGDNPPNEEARCRSISVPNDLALVSAVSGALLSLTDEANWEQRGTMDASTAADIMLAAVDAFLDSDCVASCPPVTLPGGTRIYRKNPTTKRIEYLSEDGSEEWIEPAGEEALPEPTARAETEEIDRICAAATNAVECIRVTLEDVLDAWNNVSGPAEAMTTMVTSIVGWAGATFYPPMFAFVKLVEVAFIAFYELMDAISWNFWDGDFEDALICSFRANATDTGGVITFDMDAIVADLWGQMWTRGEYVLLVTQVQYLLSIIGEQGLNIAGTTTAVAGNCSGCDTWCMLWQATNGTLGNGQWTITYGTLMADGSIKGALMPAPGNPYVRTDIQMTVDTSRCKITYMRAGVVSPVCAYSPATELYVTPGFSATRTYSFSNGWQATNGYASDESTSSSTLCRVYARANCAGIDVRINAVEIRGTGVNPFGASNC